MVFVECVYLYIDACSYVEIDWGVEKQIFLENKKDIGFCLKPIFIFAGIKLVKRPEIGRAHV
jgi:hypothetical protein